MYSKVMSHDLGCLLFFTRHSQIAITFYLCQNKMWKFCGYRMDDLEMQTMIDVHENRTLCIN